MKYAAAATLTHPGSTTTPARPLRHRVSTSLRCSKGCRDGTFSSSSDFSPSAPFAFTPFLLLKHLIRRDLRSANSPPVAAPTEYKCGFRVPWKEASLLGSSRDHASLPRNSRRISEEKQGTSFPPLRLPSPRQRRDLLETVPMEIPLFGLGNLLPYPRGSSHRARLENARWFGALNMPRANCFPGNWQNSLVII